MTPTELQIAKTLKSEKIEKLEITPDKVIIYIQREGETLNEKLTKENYTSIFIQFLLGVLRK